MPITVNINDEIAEAIKTNTAVQDAIKAQFSGAKFTIPEDAIEEVVTEMITKGKVAPPKATATATNEGIADAILGKLEAMATKTPVKAKKMKSYVASRSGKLAKTGEPVLKVLMKYCSPGLPPSQGKQNLRLCGPAGASKTWRARQFGAMAGFDRVIEVQCLSDMEPRDFIAGPTPGEQTKGFRAPFVDGPLAKAQRLARDGNNVLIILDEVGNVPKSAKQAFQSWLSPFGERGDEMCKLVTGRAIEAIDVNGVPLPPSHADYHAPYIEEIDAPFANITIVGTQNVGAEYDCPEDSPAITARLMPIHVATDSKLIKSVIGRICDDDIGWSKGVSTFVCNALTNLWKASLDAKDKSLLAREISLREMIVCLNQISGIADKSIENVSNCLQKELVSDGVRTWFVSNSHKGEPMKEQVAAWKDIVKVHVPITKA